MRKVEITYSCDICGNPLPKEYVKQNQREDTYFDHNRYNAIRLGDGRGVSISLSVVACGHKQDKLCPKCRVDVLRDVLRKLESELEE